jgi:formyltetrahydrofolate synthetase
MHTGKYKIVPGKPLDPGLIQENVPDVEQGAANMVQHLENMRKFGVNPVVAINVFSDDTDKEIQVVKEIAMAHGAVGVAICNHWAEGGKGATELAEMVVTACDQPSEFKFLYDANLPIKDKIEVIAREIYRPTVSSIQQPPIPKSPP